MEYINIHSSTVDSVEFQTADDSQQATWLKLLRFLCGQENGDRIRDAKAWQDRVWIRLCNVTPRVIKRPSPLWQWEGNDLIVKFYPHKQEATTKALREAGSRGGRPAKAGLKAGPEHNGTEANETKANGSGCSEVPGDGEVSAFCAGYQDLSRGIKGIPETWWRWWRSTRRNFTNDWKRCLVDAFLSDWVARTPKAVGASNSPQKKYPAPISGEMPPVPGAAAADISAMLKP
jgi:hypothetical protein